MYIYIYTYTIHIHMFVFHFFPSKEMPRMVWLSVGTWWNAGTAATWEVVAKCSWVVRPRAALWHWTFTFGQRLSRHQMTSEAAHTKWWFENPDIYILLLYVYTILYKYYVYIYMYIYIHMYVWLVFLKIYSRLCIRPAVDFHTFFRWQGWPVSWSWVDLLAALASCPPTPKAGWEGMVSSMLYVTLW